MPATDSSKLSGVFDIKVAGCHLGVIAIFRIFETETRFKVMTTPEILDILRKFKYAFSQRFGITSLGIFGSFARSQQNESSDVDVVVTLEESDFFILVAIQEELEKLTGYKVDVVNLRDSLRESFKNNILKDAIFV